VPRPSVAARKIELIGYERLRIYFLSRRDHSFQGKPFLANTTYQDILDLYACDSALRDVTFRAVGQLELLLRNAISETLSTAHGSHPYYELGAFKDAAAQLAALRTFVGVYEKSKDARAKHYQRAYSSPALPPIWTMKELLTFGATSIIFKSLAGVHKTTISKEFGVGKDTIFENWIECLVDVRNICTHHDRLFNRSFQKQPSILTSAGVPAAPQKTLKAILECLDHLLGKRGMPSGVTAKVRKIIQRYPAVRAAEAGY